MLSRSFVFLPGIGPVKETRLWSRGIDTWDAYARLKRVAGIKPRLKAQHDRLLEVAREKMTDPSFWGRTLPADEHWRAYERFAQDAAYFDIETTGDRANHVTLVGVRFRGKNRVFVRGKDYTPEAVGDFFADAKVIVSFNGASFDLPMLLNEGIRMPDVPHVDLRPVFARLEITGGLKKIEEQLGIERPDAVRGLSGWDAVKMWRKWSDKRDEHALSTLIEYNLADVENLEPLAGYACHTLQKRLLADVLAQQRLLAVEEAP